MTCALALLGAPTMARADASCDVEYSTFIAIASMRDRGATYEQQIGTVDRMKDWPDLDKRIWKLYIQKVCGYAPYADLTPRQIGNLECGNCELREH